MKQVNIQSTIELKEIIKTKYEKKDFKYFDPNPIYEYMNEKYGPQILRKTHGKELLMLLFAPKSISDDGLTYVLEFDNSSNLLFIFLKKKDGYLETIRKTQKQFQKTRQLLRRRK